MSTKDQIKFNRELAAALDQIIRERTEILEADLGELHADIEVARRIELNQLHLTINQIQEQSQVHCADADEALSKAVKDLQQQLQALKTKASTQVKRLFSDLHDTAREFEKNTAVTNFQMLDTAEAFSECLPTTTVRKLIEVGEIRPVGPEVLDCELPPVMARLPLIDSGHIIIEAAQTDPALKTLLQNLVSQVYTAVPAGQVIVTVFNPRSNKILANFMPTGASDAGLFKTIQPIQRAFEQALEEHLDFIGNTQASIGSHGTMGDLIQETGQHEYPYRVLVILDAPSDWSQKSVAILDKLMHAGAAAGLSVIMHRDPNVPIPDRVDVESVYKYASVISLENDQATIQIAGLKDKPAIPVKLSPAHLDIEYTNLLKVVVKAAQTGSLPNIPLRELISMEQRKSDYGLAITMGRKGTQQTEFVLGDTNANIQNLLIGGRAGSGKTNLLKVIIYSMATRYRRDELELFLLDFKEGGDFIPFAGENGVPPLPNAKVVTRNCDAAFGMATLRHFKQEMERRASLTSDNGVANIWNLREKTGIVMPRWVLIIDEFQGLFNKVTSQEATSLLEDLVRKGRSFGLHVMLATQTLSGVSFYGDKDKAIFENIAGRIVLQLGPGEFSKFMGVENEDGHMLRYRGQAIFNPQAGLPSENQLFVVARADEEYTNQLQGQLYQEAEIAGDLPPRPLVYRGDAVVTARQLLERASRPEEYEGTLPLWVGQETTIEFNVAKAVFSPIPGSHVLLLGGDEKSMPRAIATLQAAVLSAVAAASDPSIRVICFDGLIPHFRATASMERWFETLKNLGANVEVYGPDCVEECVKEIVLSNNNRDRVIVALLGAENSDFKSVAESAGWNDFIRVLPRRNVNVIGHWTDLRDVPGDQFSVTKDYKTMLFFGKNGQLVRDTTKTADNIPAMHHSRTLIYSATNSQDGLRTVMSIETLSDGDFQEFERVARFPAGKIIDIAQYYDALSTVSSAATAVEDIFGNERKLIHNDQTVAIVGRSNNGIEQLLFDDQNGISNLIITGELCSGYTRIAKIIFASIANSNATETVQLDFIERRDSESDFAEYIDDQKLPHSQIATGVENETDFYQLLEQIRDEINQRIYKKSAASSNDDTGSAKRRRIIFIHDIGDFCTDNVKQILKFISTTGPQHGVHLVMVAEFEQHIIDMFLEWNPNAAQLLTRMDSEHSWKLLGSYVANKLESNKTCLLRRGNSVVPIAILSESEIGDKNLRNMLESRLGK
ncbi:FtsK/SpoIIIE domain-containing protein [Corynebacterium sp. HS2168-gen11]|uniref:FtsK/SpoIIIE domain-containing protein n=1 Tax=Corynebacterium sp. HS2168-gen11 TaxID=2974027 RepID=UPI00216B1031|nr:FtsK/SpoIIIE domain-containing protein [Corynebacterium sp. HS2168-gen11]MCS4534953.1 FtsK/SpoIIIE domain-containing protein [Corynebacterium sp. HS2168-gen11]